MVTGDKTPGLHVEGIPNLPPSVTPVETAVPAFIGYTEKAEDLQLNDLHLKPTRISSMVEYETYFGLPQPEAAITVAVTVTTVGDIVTPQKAVSSLTQQARSKHIVYYALQTFFANGGGPCYVVSVGPYKALGSPLDEAELSAGLDAARKQDEPTLIVFPEAQGLAIDKFRTLQDAALQQCADLMDRFVVMDVHGDTEAMSDPAADLVKAITNFRTRGLGADNLKYGAAYAPNIETTLEFSFDATMTQVAIETDGVLAPPVGLATLEATENAIFAMAKASIADLPCILPPSAAMAGVYATVDINRGVWKAPANVNVAAVTEPTIPVSDTEQDQMNVDLAGGKSVNAIRSFPGDGALVWGARTLAGNDNEWRYISVRRFFIFVEASVTKATTQFVFEPNDANTWIRVQGMIETFLTTLWRQGALQGVKLQDAFYVAVGLGKTMTALDILEGRMIVEIGMAPVRPAEFIILRFSQKMAAP
ncbi:phage tail sheath family protein [Phenylobacterium sp.]|uniref:phage tail sheath family protein n=1 Tax=Phenylobacterium sp. TaxID=1871053 RepID=UPI002F3EED5F